jgi:hypothetical protein
MQERINCLRCKHAQLAAKSNCQIIKCGKQKNKIVDINLLGCPLTNSEWSFRGGDKLKKISSVEKEFLKQNYLRMSTDDLTKITVRSKNTLWCVARRMGMLRPKVNPPRDGYKSRKSLYTEEQRAFLFNQIKKGLWPISDRYAPYEKELKTFILQKVAELGPSRTWRQLISWKHLQKKSRKWQSENHLIPKGDITINSLTSTSTLPPAKNVATELQVQQRK